MAQRDALDDRPLDREEACRLCGGTAARLLAETDYWDIRSTRIVRCDGCNLMQLDPMLTAENTARGALAYHVEESLRVSRHEQQRNLVRNYRRGVHFAAGLQSRGIAPQYMLELGPGSGYFAEGMRRVFPELQVVVMDVVPEVLVANKRDHGFAGIRSMPETHQAELDGRFDLIVARDILEHVIDIGAVLRHAHRYLRPGGHLHFITPNGHEDVWKHRLRWRLGGERSELLINHVNYFDGAGLRKHLERLGFGAVQYYTYDLKPRRRGRGWSKAQKQWAPTSVKRRSAEFAEERLHEVQDFHYNKDEVLPAWYRNGSLPLLRILCAYQHGHLLRIDPARNIGHEIHGLFRKHT